MKPSTAFANGRRISHPFTASGNLCDRWVEQDTGEIVYRTSHLGAMAVGWAKLEDHDLDGLLGPRFWWWPRAWVPLAAKMPCECYVDTTYNWPLDVVLMHLGQLHHPVSQHCRLDAPTWTDRQVFDWLRSNKY